MDQVFWLALARHLGEGEHMSPSGNNWVPCPSRQVGCAA